MPPPSVSPLIFPSSLSSPLHSLLPPSPLPSPLTPWVQSLEVVIKSDFEGPIRRLSEEGWNNPGECECVCVCVGGGGREESVWVSPGEGKKESRERDRKSTMRCKPAINAECPGVIDQTTSNRNPDNNAPQTSVLLLV